MTKQSPPVDPFSVLGSLALGLSLLFAQSALADPLAEPPPLVEATLQPGEAHTYPFPQGPQGLPQQQDAWWIAVEQQGIDVVVSVLDASGAAITSVDNPLDRYGEELLLFTPGDDQESRLESRLEIRSRDSLALPGRYRLRWRALPPTEAPPYRQAARATSVAGELYKTGTPEAWRQARERHREAAAWWGEAGEAERRARALYAAAVLSRLLDDTASALELGERARLAFVALGSERWQGYARVELGLVRWMAGESGTAVGQFATALRHFAAAEDGYGEAVARHNLCLMHLVKGDLRAGRACYEADLPVLEAARSAEMTGAAHTNLGRVYDRLGEPRRAREHYQRALEPLRAVGDAVGEARTLNNLGVLERGLGETGAAIATYGRALEIFRRLGDRRWQARVLNNLGAAYLALGEPRRAVTGFEQALELWRQVGDARGEATTWRNLGTVAMESQQPSVALDRYRRALALRRASGDGAAEGALFAHVGEAQRSLGDEDGAAASFAHALDLLRRSGDRSAETLALLGQGRLLLQQGQAAAAAAILSTAVNLARELGYQQREALALERLARAELAQGHAPAARARVQEAVAILDSLRTEIRDPDLSATFSRRRHDIHALQVELWMAAHDNEPAAGFDHRALEAAEAARARTLLAVLVEAQADIGGGGAAPRSAAQRRALLERLAAKTQRALALPPDDAERKTLEKERLEVLGALDLVEAEIRTADPAFAALTAPQPLTVAEIQGLLDDHTVLLSYFLGEERSFLWWVTPDRVESFPLPPRKTLESLARELHTQWSTPNTSDWRDQTLAAQALGKILLGPVAAHLEDHRLAVIPDGALSYLPFSALVPPGGQAPLLHSHEVVVLPSASSLAARRAMQPPRTPPPGWLAIVADPVFQAEDPRLVASSPRAATRGGENFPRLPASRQEAEAILALAPPERTLRLFDFDADRRAVLEGNLKPFRVVHFATHGVLDTAQPSLSGLVLSQVGPDGEPQSGFLGLHDIYNLDLQAELVVLSGCRTALGEEMQGEGLVGLTRGFMYAGAPRVIASLWPVEDRATARLMALFYQALWRDGLPAAAALRQAQLQLSAERRWRDPYYWASFILQGEWR